MIKIESNNWIAQNLNGALETWNGYLSEIWSIISTSPEVFRGGDIWRVMVTINGALQGIGFGLLVLFFAAGVVKTCGSFAELKKPEHAVKVLVRFIVARSLIIYGLDFMLALIAIAQGTIATIMNTSGFGGAQQNVLPSEVVTAIENSGFFESIPLWAVSIIGSLFITVLSLVMIMTVYGRFFKLYLYIALAPIPLSSFAGEPTQFIGKSFLKSFAAVCLEGVIIVLACIIFSVFADTSPDIAAGTAPITIVWNYVTSVIFNMLVLVGCVKMADRSVRELMGL